MKACLTCKVEKAEADFRSGKSRSGKTYLRGNCRTCDNKKNSLYRKQDPKKYAEDQGARNYAIKERNRAWLEEQKKKPCLDCGGTFPPICMDFDHVKPGKFRDLARLAQSTYRLEVLEAEIAKCELVCACCHRIRTQKRNQYGHR